MSQNIFVTIKGEKQGLFAGEERDGTIEVLHYEQLMISPRDPASGISNGRLKHHPIIMRKQVDSSSPFLETALTTTETLESVVFRFVPTSYTAGMPPSIYFVRLENASIASFKQFFSDTPSSRYVGWQLLEEIGFHYLKIEWGFNDKVMASGEWPLGL